MAGLAQEHGLSSGSTTIAGDRFEKGIASSARLGGGIGDEGRRLSSRATTDKAQAGRQRLLLISNAVQALEEWGKEGRGRKREEGGEEEKRRAEVRGSIDPKDSRGDMEILGR